MGHRNLTYGMLGLLHLGRTSLVRPTASSRADTAARSSLDEVGVRRRMKSAKLQADHATALPGDDSTKKSVAVIGTRGYPSYYGGFETAIRKVAPFLADAGWDVTVYGRPTAIKSDDAGLDPRVTSVITKGLDTNSLSTLSYGLTSCLHAVVHKPDVALVMNVANGFWLPLLKLRGIRTVVNVDGIEWHRAKWGRFAKAMFRWGARLTARFGDELVFDARAIEDFWFKEFGRTGTFIPYGGDEVPALSPVDGLASGSYAMLVARFVPENTVSEFVEAAAEIARTHDVVIVGSADEGNEIRQQVEALANSSERVHWLGHVSDDARLFALWQHAGVYFHGHSVGGTNPALVQAMACCASVVARDTVYNREVLSDGAVFVEPTPAAIASAVLTLLGDEPKMRELSEQSSRRAADAYAWPMVCGDYERLLATTAGLGALSTESVRDVLPTAAAQVS